MPCGLASRRIVSPWNNGGSLFNNWDGLRHIEPPCLPLLFSSFPLSFAPACFRYSLYLLQSESKVFDHIRELFEKTFNLYSTSFRCRIYTGIHDIYTRGASNQIFYAESRSVKTVTPIFILRNGQWYSVCQRWDCIYSFEKVITHALLINDSV